jgi:hypothetical protein
MHGNLDPPEREHLELRLKYKDYDGTIVPINFNKNMCNEFTYRHVSLLDEVGFYEEKYKSLFDVEWVFRASKHSNVSPFWYFADFANSDNFIANNDETQSVIDPDGDRWKWLTADNELFVKTYGHNVAEIPLPQQTELISKLKTLIGK